MPETGALLEESKLGCSCSQKSPSSYRIARMPEEVQHQTAQEHGGLSNIEVLLLIPR
jgi:hypothetical protein